MPGWWEIKLTIAAADGTIGSREAKACANAEAVLRLIGRLVQDRTAAQWKVLDVLRSVRLGTHGTHVSVGLIWILILSAQVAIKGLRLSVTSRLFRLGLFWHFLDIAWVGIFSVVYLPGLL